MVVASHLVDWARSHTCVICWQNSFSADMRDFCGHSLLLEMDDASWFELCVDHLQLNKVAVSQPQKPFHQSNGNSIVAAAAHNDDNDCDDCNDCHDDDDDHDDHDDHDHDHDDHDDSDCQSSQWQVICNAWMHDSVISSIVNNDSMGFPQFLLHIFHQTVSWLHRTFHFMEGET